MTEGTQLATWSNSASGPTVGTDAMTISSSAVVVEQVKLTLGDLVTFTGQMGGRNTDGSATIAAGFIDPRPDDSDVQKSPTITASSAYASGNCLGTVIDFGAIARASGGGILVAGAVLEDSSQQNAPIDLFLFNSNPSNGTYTDKTTPTFNATDAKLIRGVVPFGAYSNIGSGGSVCAIANVGIQILLNGTQHMYGLLINRGTPTYTSTSAVTLSLSFIAD